MSENVYTKLLRQLVEWEGSAQAVAGLLRVPESTMVRWMNGRAQMPLRAFLQAMNLVVEHELRRGVPAGGDSAAETLSFKVGPVVARCAKCGSHEFGRADPALPLTYKSLLACRGCGGRIVHGDLIVELAKEVSLHARSSLARSKARNGRRAGTKAQ